MSFRRAEIYRLEIYRVQPVDPDQNTKYRPSLPDLLHIRHSTNQNKNKTKTQQTNKQTKPLD
jgi:hypothetical protein